jgi:hypothetical protein
MRLRFLFATAMLAMWAGNATAGRACPSDAATGAGTVCDKTTHATHAAASVRLTDASIVASAASPTHTATNPGCCSMPFHSAASDVAPTCGVTAANHAAGADPATTAHAVKSALVKPAARQPQRSAVAPAFGPLFLAHQALML